MVQKVVANKQFGGYSVDGDAVRWMREQGDEEAQDATLAGEYYSDGSGPRELWAGDDSENVYSISRDNELLVKLVEGDTDYDGPVSGSHATLEVVEIPDGVNWEIDEYDGAETIREKTEVFG